MTGNPLIGGKYSKSEYEQVINSWQNRISGASDEEEKKIAEGLLHQERLVILKLFGVKSS